MAALAQTAPTKTLTPLKKMRKAFPDAHQRRNGFWGHDDNPDFDFLEQENGNILIHSWVPGRSVEDILAMGKTPLTKRDLCAKPGTIGACIERDKLDLLTLSQYLLIHWKELEQMGFSDGYNYNGKLCVRLGGYYNRDGSEHSKHRLRLALHGNGRFRWNEHTAGKSIPCGYQGLDHARRLGYLLIGEGESDWATCTHHGIPFLGIPGANSVTCLDVSLLADIPAVYIVEEPDQTQTAQRKGEGFYKQVRSWLRSNGYTGDIFCIRFEQATGHKDPSALHKALFGKCDPAELTARFQSVILAAMNEAIPEGNGALPMLAPAPIDLEQFIRQVWAVKSDILSDRQKNIIIYLFLYLRDVQPTDKGTPLDADKAASELGIPKKDTLLEEIGFLTNKMGLFFKLAIATPNPDVGKGKAPYLGKTVYLTPTRAYYQPAGYCMQESLGDRRNHGGYRHPKPRCINCQSENLDHYLLHHCNDCGYDHFTPLHVAPPTFEQQESNKQEVEGSLTEIPSETPKMGCSDKDEQEEAITVTASVEVANLNGHHATFSLFDQVEQAKAFAESVTPPPYDGPNPPPARRTLCCKSTWRWDSQEQHYVCAACHPPDTVLSPYRLNHARLDGGLWEVTP